MKKWVLVGLFMCFCLSTIWAQRPYALGTFPNDGATHIFCNTFVRVHIHFPGEGKQLDSRTLIRDHIKLYPKNEPEAVLPAELQYDKGFRQIHLRPLEVLKPETDYIFEITPGLKDERNNSFLNYRLQFRTGNCQRNLLVSRGGEVPPAEPEVEIPQPNIDFAKVKARLLAGKVLFEWSTNQEFMQASFQLSRSADRKVFSELLSVDSQGDSDSVQAYACLDSLPQAGMNYYSLTAFNIYGESGFSDTLAVFSERVSIAQDTVAQNGHLAVDILVAPRTSMAFVLKSLEGKEVLKKAAFLPHDQDTFHISFKDVPTGTYDVLLVTPQSRVEKRIKVE